MTHARTLPWLSAEKIVVDGLPLTYERHGAIYYVVMPGTGQKVSDGTLLALGHKVEYPRLPRIGRLVA